MHNANNVSNRATSWTGAMVTFVASVILVPGEGLALSINVDCAGAGISPVGTINVNAVAGSGVTGGFDVTIPLTLDGAAAQCDEDHFNWYQTVQGVHPLIPGGGPQVDPQPGGQGGQWADMLPWYWDESAPAPGTPGYDPIYQLSNNETVGGLGYFDHPFGPIGTTLTFMTWLVSLNANGSFHSWHEGFQWSWERDAIGITVGNPTALAGDPTDAKYKDIIGSFDVPEPATGTFVSMGLVILSVSRRRSRGVT